MARAQLLPRTTATSSYLQALVTRLSSRVAEPNKHAPYTQKGGPIGSPFLQVGIMPQGYPRWQHVQAIEGLSELISRPGRARTLVACAARAGLVVLLVSDGGLLDLTYKAKFIISRSLQWIRK
jgi:hypothetical protein